MEWNEVQSRNDMLIWLTTKPDAYKNFILERLGQPERRVRDSKKYQIHHVLTRYRRPDLVNINMSWNKLQLTYEEHTESHWLHYLCYRDPRDINVLKMRADTKPPPGVKPSSMPKPKCLQLLEPADIKSFKKRQSAIAYKSYQQKLLDPNSQWHSTERYKAMQDELMRQFLELGTTWYHPLSDTYTYLKVPKVDLRPQVKKIMLNYERKVLKNKKLTPEVRAKIRFNNQRLDDCTDNSFGAFLNRLAENIAAGGTVELSTVLK